MHQRKGKIFQHEFQKHVPPKSDPFRVMLLKLQEPIRLGQPLLVHPFLNISREFKELEIRNWKLEIKN